MPELAEVEVARTRVESWWSGRAATELRVHDAEVITRKDELDVRELFTSTVGGVRRRGKYLIIDFERGHAVFHFRMTGKITLSEVPARRFTRLSWLVEEAGWLVFDDARRLGEVVVMSDDPLTHHAPLLEMGPEPHALSSGEQLKERLGGTRRKLKDALLDQGVVAGVGNIAISELFWRAQLAPTLRADEATLEQLDALVAQMPLYFDWLVQDQMADEIIYLSEGKARNPFSMYAREGEACPRCQAAIERATFGGRSTYFCPVCQAK